jgi:hypothetical protein
MFIILYMYAQSLSMTNANIYYRYLAFVATFSIPLSMLRTFPIVYVLLLQYVVLLLQYPSMLYRDLDAVHRTSIQVRFLLVTCLATLNAFSGSPASLATLRA